MVWLVAPSLIAGNQGVLAALGEGDSTKVLGTDLSHWELTYAVGLVMFFRSQALPLREPCKNEIDLLPDSVPPAKVVQNVSCGTC